jgi:hypothetical protein
LKAVLAYLHCICYTSLPMEKYKNVTKKFVASSDVKSTRFYETAICKF